MLQPGDKVVHRYNRELGPGEILAREGSRLRIHFPRARKTLEFSSEEEAFTPLVLPPGTDPERWHEALQEDMVERLARLSVDRLSAWENRMESLRLSRIREADGLGSFLGGRIEIFPHQLHVAEQAVTSDPVRWLLADEVGLGKTVEACLILSRLLRQRRADRVLVVAPESLTVQWLGELYRKFHQVFVLLDRERRRDVKRDFGPEWNPFEVHPRSVVALEDLVGEGELARAAQAAPPDLLVVDESHRLERRPGHPGSAAYRAVAPLCKAARHVLLLSATPLEADAHGFFRLLELLRPDLFDSWDAFRSGLDRGEPIQPLTSATTRADIGGLPPRVPYPVSLSPWPSIEAKEKTLLAEPASTALEHRRRAERIQELWERPHGEGDPRLQWILSHAESWREGGDKMLLFVHRRESLEFLKKEIERNTFHRVGIFHEDLSPAARDLEVAQFALPDGPSLLISTESGGEGRNFTFCRGIVLFDLPWDPVLVEQRIGRLDRINRRGPVEIHYFVPTGGYGGEVARLYEALGIFREPLGGLDRSLGHVEEALTAAILRGKSRLDIEEVVAETKEARSRVNRALYHDLHRHRYRPDRAAAILERVPADLEPRTARVVREACRQFGFETVAKPGENVWYFEFGPEATVEHVPGVPEGSRFLGTFNREEAVLRETLDFFAAGHPLVEGVLLELEDGHRGEVAMFEVRETGLEGEGLAAVVREGAHYRTVVVNFQGDPQPEWADLVGGEDIVRHELRPGDWNLGSDPELLEVWATQVRELLYPLQQQGSLAAVAAFRLRA